MKHYQYTWFSSVRRHIIFYIERRQKQKTGDQLINKINGGITGPVHRSRTPCSCTHLVLPHSTVPTFPMNTHRHIPHKHTHSYVRKPRLRTQLTYYYNGMCDTIKASETTNEHKPQYLFHSHLVSYVLAYAFVVSVLSVIHIWIRVNSLCIIGFSIRPINFEKITICSWQCIAQPIWVSWRRILTHTYETYKIWIKEIILSLYPLKYKSKQN